MKKIDTLIRGVYPQSLLAEWVVAEPFTGGGGSLINMAEDFPNWTFHINDLNPEVSGMWAFLKDATNDEFKDLYTRITTQKATAAEYQRIFKSIPQNNLERTFKIIFLNKTSFSGFITKNRPIGGFEQKGKWKVDVYWNPKNIISKIERARRALEGKIISVSCLDFETFLIEKEFNFIYSDPPYIAFGKEWYNCSFDIKDLKRLQEVMSKYDKWCLSIDRNEDIESMFKGCNKLGVDVKHTAKSSYKTAMEGEDKKILSVSELVIFP